MTSLCARLVSVAEAVALSPAHPVGHPFADLVLLTPDEGFFNTVKMVLQAALGYPSQDWCREFSGTNLDVRMLAAT